MRINPQNTIAGVPILEVRALMRWARGWHWPLSAVEERLKVGREQAVKLLGALEHSGYVERSLELRENVEPYYQVTICGCALAMATAGKPIKRKTADRLLAAFLNRVSQANDNDYYLYKVTRVVVFGSYLDQDKQELNDLDLAIDLAAKETDGCKHEELLKARIMEVYEKGRHFKNIVDQLAWPQTEVKQFLKSGSTAISLHNAEAEKEIWLNGSHRIVVPAAEQSSSGG